MNLKEKIILLVEDDLFSAEYIKELLLPSNLKLIHTKSGKDAVTICRENQQIDLVVMDIRLLDLNGLEATRQIKQMRTTLPIIAQTANAMPEDKVDCIMAGCDDYISKPINVTYFFELLYKHLIN